MYKRQVNILYTRPLPAAQYKLGPMTLRNTLQVLSGPAWQVKVDEVARQVCFVLRPGYQPVSYTHLERVQLGREDTAGWKMDTYQTTLNWLNLKTQEEISLNEAQAREQLIDLIRRKPSEEQPRGWKARLKCLISD